MIDRQVYKREDGSYGTIPDGDDATIEEICRFIHIEGGRYN